RDPSPTSSPLLSHRVVAFGGDDTDQLVLLDLARCRGGQHVEHLEPLWQLELRESDCFEPHDDGLEIDLCARSQYHARAHALAETLIGQPDHRGTFDLGHRNEQLFDFARRDVEATTDDDLL